MIRTTTLSIQQNKDTPRIWIEGQYLALAGFSGGSKITIQYLKDCIEVNLDNNGTRTVCCKKSPIIDIQNKAIQKVFKTLSKVKVIVEIGKIFITKTKLQLRKEYALKDRSFGSVFSGGGLLDEAACQSGLHGKFAIEVNTKYADIFQMNHNSEMYNTDIAEVEFDKLQQVEFLLAGIPCEPFSPVRQNQEGLHKNEDLSMFFLMVVEHVNPRTIILEEVPQYLKSVAGQTTIQALKRLGYNVESKILCGDDFGLLQKRKRAIIIASYDQVRFPETTQKTVKAESILETNIDSQDWFDQTTKPWIFKSWQRNKFKRSIITSESTVVPAITKKYHRFQQTSPYVKHPTEEKYRRFTESEVRKLFTLRESYNLGEVTEHKYGVLGQGIIIKIFQQVISGMMA